MHPDRVRVRAGDSRIVLALAILVGLGGASRAAQAFRIADVAPVLGAPNPVYIRWDAAPRIVEGVERSLDGGLRYSLEGGSYQAFRDQFTWTTVPTVAEFQSVVEQSFAFWTATDPETGLSTPLYFVADLSTPVVDQPGDLSNPFSFLGLNDGAEIDLIADTPHLGPAFAGSAIAFVEFTSFHDITLTSGTTGYAGFAASGVDIRINPALTYDLGFFQTLLTHELGHAIGFADFAMYPGVLGVYSPFFDDDYDGTSSATALATLTNSFALEIDPFDPDSTPLVKIAGALNGDPGLATPGVEMLMEQLFVDRMSNNEFAGRQFLYPVPEPATLWLLGFGFAALAGGRGARRPR